MTIMQFQLLEGNNKFVTFILLFFVVFCHSSSVVVDCWTILSPSASNNYLPASQRLSRIKTTTTAKTRQASNSKMEDPFRQLQLRQTELLLQQTTLEDSSDDDDDDASLATTATTASTVDSENEGVDGCSTSRVRDTAGQVKDAFPSALKPTVGSIVTIDCKLVPEGDNFVPEPLFDGIVFRDHEDDTPPIRLVFALGKGNYLPGVHATVLGMKQGQTITDLSLDAGWGAINPNLIATLSFQQAGITNKDAIKPGVKLILVNGMTAVVTDVDRTEDQFTIDANSPSAGTSYLATITLVNVEEGPAITEYNPNTNDDSLNNSKYEIATFALGCFWGAELEYMRIPGVVGTSVGYTQGTMQHPTYKDVCSGTTGHTESILVTYDPTVISYEKLVHTAMDRLGENKYLKNQVGNDKGTQYRHGIYYHTANQKSIAERIVQGYGPDCKTEVSPATKFYFAEDYHQQYLLKGGQSARKNETTNIRCYG